jgi:hypothetical protein
MLKLAGKGLTARGVAAFWVPWSLAFVLMLWAVSPGAPCKTHSSPSSCKDISRTQAPAQSVETICRRVAAKGGL